MQSFLPYLWQSADQPDVYHMRSQLAPSIGSRLIYLTHFIMHKGHMMAASLYNDYHAILFIKAADHAAFLALASKFISTNTGEAAPDTLSLASKFLTDYGLKLWPRDKYARRHLEPAPSDENKNYWKRGFPRAGLVAGPIFERHAQMNRGARHRWRKINNDATPSTHVEISRSKLGKTLQGYFSTIVEKGPWNGSTQLKTLEELLQMILDNKPDAMPQTSTERPLARSSRPAAKSFADAQDEMGLPTFVSCTAQDKSQLRDGDNAIHAIKRTRSQNDVPSTVNRRRTKVPAASSGTAPKTTKKKAQASLPPTGTFTIPRSMRRVEAIPLRGPISADRDEGQSDSTDSTDSTEDVAMREKVAKSMEETGGMGGLPFSQ